MRAAQHVKPARTAVPRSEATPVAAGGVVQREVRGQSFAEQARTLTPKENDKATEADGFAELLAAAEVDPARCDATFISALSAKAGVLTPAEAAALSRIVATVDTATKTSLLKAIGCPTIAPYRVKVHASKLEPRIDPSSEVASLALVQAQLTPNDRLLTKPVGATISCALEIEISFPDATLEAMFTELVKLPRSARQDPTTLLGFRRTLGGRSSLWTGNQAYVADRAVFERVAGERWDAGAQKGDKDPAKKQAFVAEEGRKLQSKSVCHEVGHAFDARDHVDAWHVAAGWQTYKGLAALPPGLLWRGAPDHPEYKAKATPIFQAILADNAVPAPDIKAKVGTADPQFAKWIEATDGYQIFAKSRHPLDDWNKRHRVDGGLISPFPGGNRFYHASAALTAQLVAWNNGTAAFTPREWAAECYAAWFHVDKPGDPYGKKPEVKHLSQPALDWVAKVHPDAGTHTPKAAPK